MVFPSDQRHRTLKNRKGAHTQKKGTPCFQDVSITNRFNHKNLPASSFPVSLRVVLSAESSGAFPRPFVFFAKSHVHAARINSRIWEDIGAVCYKANFHYWQILVGSHGAWGVSVVSGKQTPAAAASLPSSSSQTAGVGGQEARVSSQRMLLSYHRCPK